MKNKVLRNLTFQNLKAHKKVIWAFVLASSIFMGLVYISISLINNEYVQRRHEILPKIMIFGAILIVIFSLIFIVYANNFIMKQRYKEFGLYRILGLEKKHIKKVIRYELLLEYLIISIFSIIGGYLFGSLSFMFVNKLMQETSTGIFHYPFDIYSAVLTLIILFIIMLIVYLFDAIKINKSNPLKLISLKSKGEKEPKANIFIMILGIIFLIWGYYIAFSTEGVVASVFKIFQAILFVIIGTYFLFISLSIFILKLLKKNKKYYYKVENFLSISGMLYRMKANAVSLASISILITGIMLVLGMTFTTSISIDDIANSGMDCDYIVNYSGDENLLNEVVSEMKKHINIKKVLPHKYINLSFELANKKLSVLDGNSDIKNAGMGTIMSVDDYNSAYGENLSLSENQIGFSTNAKRWAEFDKLNIIGKDYNIINIKQKPDNKIAVDYAIIVIPQKINYEDMIKAYPNITNNGVVYSEIRYAANIIADGNLKENQSKINEISNKYEIIIDSKIEIKNHIYQINGGLLFLGIIVGAILLVGTFLMIYFKQMSEGYDDVENFNIMKQVGLDDKLIRKTIRSQIKWIFILPVLIAIIHSIASSKIVFNLLGVVGVRNYSLFINNYILIIIIFAIIYGIMYIMTSKLYYNIINGNQ